MADWFAVHTKASKEQLARDDLRRRKIEVFWPYISEWVGTGHKFKSRLVKRSWLSRYLFVRCDRGQLGPVSEALGVSTVVRATNNEPHPIPDLAMQLIIEQADHLGEVYVGQQVKKLYRCKEGDMIRFTDEKSPLFGFYAEVKRVLDNGTVHAMFQGTLVGSQNIILRAADIGEVVEGAA